MKMRTGLSSTSIVFIAAALCFAGCGGESEPSEIPTSGETGIETPRSDEAKSGPESETNPEPTGNEETTRQQSCEELSLGGQLTVGEVDLSLSGGSISIRVDHNGTCLHEIDLSMTTDAGCNLELAASVLGETNWSITAATLTECEEGSAGTLQLVAEKSTFGILTAPALGEESTCLDGESLTVAGKLVFSTGAEEVAVRLDGIAFDGGLPANVEEGLCTPDITACENQNCGEDAFGLPCGGCEDGFACLEGSCEVWNCPPDGPYGTEIGQTVLNITLQDCDGNSHSLQDLCGAPAGLFNLLAGF